MTIEVGPAIIASLIGNAVAFAAVLLRLGAIGQRLDLLWAWYLDVHNGEPQAGGRRLGDPRRRRDAALSGRDRDDGGR